LALKERQVVQALRRIGHLVDPPMRPVVPSPKPYAYRNRITVHADLGVVGYYRRDVHELIDVEFCPIAQPEVNQALAELRARQPRDGHYTLRGQRGPRIFTQTNDEVADELARLVESFIPEGQHLLIDAFCGAGFFTKRLAHKFDRLIGIEWDQFAIAAAEATATEKENYIAGDVEIELPRSLAGVDLETTSVLLDPPATGLSPATRQILTDHPVHTLVYVSCNPTTLARDLRELEKAFQIMSVTPLDMFPQTAEIEVAVHMQARRPSPDSAHD
jgi:23S rRNA (uracil1939-C5)-methyltransferase